MEGGDSVKVIRNIVVACGIVAAAVAGMYIYIVHAAVSKKRYIEQ